MKHYQYLIVGGGMSADAAARAIRDVDKRASVALITQEENPPYDRPPLSKGLWKGKPLERVWRGTSQRRVELILGRKVIDLNPSEKTLKDDQGEVYGYDRLLLATGAKPIRLPNGSEKVIYYRTLADYQQLRKLVEEKQRFVVIGGGYIGSEIAAALRMNGKDVAMVFPESGISARLFPEDLSQFINDYYREQGVEVNSEEWVETVTEEGDELVVTTRSGKTWRADGVVAGLGVRPNVELAEQAGLFVDNGIVVDSSMRTTQEDIYAAGDVANFPTFALGDRLRVEHEENANLSGMVAGHSMTGQETKYGPLPMAYSDMFDLGYESVGLLDPSLEIISDWQEPYKKGVLYYLRGGRVVGVLTMGIFGKMSDARELISRSEPIERNELKSRIEA